MGGKSSSDTEGSESASSKYIVKKKEGENRDKPHNFPLLHRLHPAQD